MTCRCVEEKKGTCIAAKICAFISPISREAPFGQIYIKFGMRGQLADVINHVKFYLNQIGGF